MPFVEILQRKPHDAGYYHGPIEKHLLKIFPPELFHYAEGEDISQKKRRFQEPLPYVFHSSLEGELPLDVSFVAIHKLRPEAYKFLFEMLIRWLVPGKRLNLLSLFASDFTIPVFGNDVYTLGETFLRIETLEELKALKANFPIIQAEIALGVTSAYYARRILEVKGLSADEKAAMVQEAITTLIHRRPRYFDEEAFLEMQHMMIRCSDSFKEARSAQHLARIISGHYLFRRNLKEWIKKISKRRQCFVKLTRCWIRGKERAQERVLGVLVGLNFLHQREVFEERHLIKAIQSLMPGAEVVENSFFIHTRSSGSIATAYMEIKKKEGFFTSAEISRLRKQLPLDLKHRVERLVHPLFMPRNEEEIMRNILNLAGQLKYLNDLPQLIVTFDEQTDTHLAFTVTYVRIVRSEGPTVSQLFQRTKSALAYVHERTKVVGHVRKRHPKEATVFHVQLPKENFLRGDHSIDLTRARCFVIEELKNVLGEFRDFNGGMIAKQDELLGGVRAKLSNRGWHHDLLTEQLFYGLTPIVMRTILPVEAVEALFVLLHQALDEGVLRDHRSLIRTAEAKGYFIALVIGTAEEKLKYDQALAQIGFEYLEMATSSISLQDLVCTGYICRSFSSARQGGLRQIF